MNVGHQGEKASIRQRLLEELLSYASISLYLWVCFLVIMLHESATVQTNPVALLPLGTAAVKALILGKFIMIGKALKAGVRVGPGVLIAKIVWRSVAMLLVLLALSAIEEVSVGLIHGRTAAEVIAKYTGSSLLRSVTSSLIMLLILIPLIAFQEIDEALGEGKLKKMLFGR